ncbi:MAG: hypothetical protein RIF41_17215 [Polyangiaceae bacterium]
MTILRRLAPLVALAAALPACSPASRAPVVPTTDDAAETTACDTALPVRDGNASWTVEGFDGGGETQLFSTKRQPVKRCSPAVVQGHRATLDALR